MIKVTRINQKVIYVNSDLIEFMEETPDTILSMTTGKKLMVTETVEEIQSEIIAFRREISVKIPQKKRQQE